LSLFLKIFKLLPPETAHSISLNSLKLLYKLKLLKFFTKQNFKNNEYYFEGMIFKNQLGTAAGLDKNGDFIDALGELGFGFLEIGTTTPLPQDGNPKPRVFRNYKENSIINRLGFNNKGVDYLVNNLKKRKYKGIVGVNIGANKTSSGKQRIDDFLICLEKVHKFADYITINISSPNTPNLRELHNKENLKILITALENKSNEIKLNIPIFIKISP
jgi:dihydroorotate dehydrogenase, subfamily 2